MTSVQLMIIEKRRKKQMTEIEVKSQKVKIQIANFKRA